MLRFLTDPVSQHLHKMKRDHPRFAPRLELAAGHQVRTLRLAAPPSTEFPSWYVAADSRVALSPGAQKLAQTVNAAVSVARAKGSGRALALLRGASESPFSRAICCYVSFVNVCRP